jgi:uncharacterized cupin superfamily protein
VNMRGSPMAPNIYDPHFDERRDTVDGFHARRARIGRQLGTERVGVSLWHLPAGQVAYPYHFHLAEEEVLVLLEGSLALRSPEGWRRMRRGDVVRFPPGADGAHQLANDTDADARFLVVSTHGQPDVVLYPDEGKIGPTERNPDGQGLGLFFRLDSAVDYDLGITRPEIPDVDPA